LQVDNHWVVTYKFQKLNTLFWTWSLHVLRGNGVGEHCAQHWSYHQLWHKLVGLQ